MGNAFKERGAFSDEAIAVMRTLWRDEDPRFDGTWSQFADMKFSPKPRQQPIPIVIGGVSRPAIRRAARLGDGWQPLGLSPDVLAEGMSTLRDELRACGRDPSAVPVSIALSLTESRPRRHALGTAPAEVVRNARAFADLGVDTLIVSPTTSDPAEARASLEMVAREVLPAVR
jgi:alkanesulfonate monooxygenase SsuD/methylene tetrahydromethanopterin reductase-like flavin-dependent oxidoreductase (luciferase family)